MPEPPLKNLPHLILSDTAQTERYTTVFSGGPKHKHPVRNRQEHGRTLLAKLERIREEAESGDFRELLTRGQELGLFMPTITRCADFSDLYPF